MAMGGAKRRQEGLWVTASELPRSPGHPFYTRLNQALDAEGFDRFVESRCRAFYAGKVGRPSLPPGVYFRMLLIGYFEGIDSERGIAWRAADSLALRSFLGYRAGRADAGSLDDLADPAADRRGDAPGGLQLGSKSAWQRRVC